jgi:Ni2+-binding GTPase involved in maturation of urease and hydrogenase
MGERAGIVRFIVIGGFLGAGKTSLISALAEAYAQDGQRVVVLENEAGRAGLDSELLAGQGIKVERMLGGCACCDLLPMLLTKMQTLADEAEAQLVLFEPSGVAALDSLLSDLVKHAPGQVDLGVVVVMDATRFDIMRQAMANLLRGQLSATRMLVLSKVDLVSAAEFGEVQAQLREQAPGVALWPANLASPQAGDVAADLVRVLENIKVDPCLLLSQDSPYQAYSWDLQIASPDFTPEKALAFLDELLTVTGREAGQGLSHVKLLGHDQQGRLCFVSGTSRTDLGLRGEAGGPLQGRALCEVISFGKPSIGLEQSLRLALEGHPALHLA